MSKWRYFIAPTRSGIVYAEQGKSFGFIRRGWFEGEDILHNRPCKPKDLQEISTEEARKLLRSA